MHAVDPYVMKTCIKCGVTKPYDQFYAFGAMKDGYRNDCKPCHRAFRKQRYDSTAAVERATRWRQANPERVRENARLYRQRNSDRLAVAAWRRRYGLSEEAGKEWLASKDGGCRICTSTQVQLDHDHATGRIRGWLCGSCNRALGLFHDDLESLKAAVRYLEDGQ